MSLAALRNQAPPKAFADRDAIADLGLDLAKPGDVLVAVEGGTVGEALVVPGDIDEFVPSQQVVALRVVDTTRLDPWYLGAWLSTEPAREQLRLARGRGIQRIPIKDLASLSVEIPPLADQREIGRRFLGFENAIRAHRAVTVCLEQLRDLDLVVTFADSDRSHPRDQGIKKRTADVR
jgi:restriction endonuclease S subunit